MSTLKADGIIASTGTNTNLTLEGKGTGGVKITDYLIQTKGSDIASATALTLGTDGNSFDVTGTTTITSIATLGIGSHVTLHFDGILTFTHHSTDLILPGAANITTAAGDIAVMYEYASGDWRCINYTKASGVAVVVAAAGGFTLGTEQASTSGTAITFGSIPADTTMIVINWNGVSADSAEYFELRIGDAGGLETSGYSSLNRYFGTGVGVITEASDAIRLVNDLNAAQAWHGSLILTLQDSTNNHWMMQCQIADIAHSSSKTLSITAGSKALSAELTQVSINIENGAFDAGSLNIMYQ